MKRLTSLSTSIIISLLLGSQTSLANFEAPAPKPTETTKTCKTGTVWDKEKKTCIAIKDSRFNDQDIFEHARELAYEHRAQDAIELLHMAQETNNPKILNYLGFAHRKAGNFNQAIAYYSQALAIDPNYFLARSYMGQGYAAEGQETLALAQLAQIRNRGGESTWAYQSLEQAINNHSHDY
jgi:tetratricopeptide (TPR) repeat protein